MEVELFTETYKSLNAPIKEIFTAGYLPRTQPVKLVAINTKANKDLQQRRGVSSMPPSSSSSQPIRLVVTQDRKDKSARPHNTNGNNNVASSSTTNKNNNNGRINDYGRRPPTSLTSSSASLRDRERERERERELEKEREREREQRDREHERERERERDRERERERGRAAYREGDSYRPVRNDRYDSGSSFSHNNSNNNNNNNNNNSGRGRAIRRESPAPQQLQQQPQQQQPQQQQRRESTMETTRRNSTRDDSYMGSNSNISNNHNNINNNLVDNSPISNNVRVTDRLSRPEFRPSAPVASNRMLPEVILPDSKSEAEDMDIDDVVIRGAAAPGSPDVSFRVENGPCTIEIDNLDPGTTADDVKFVCSRYGEIKTCVCSRGFAQVTYARRAAGEAAVEGLHGKRADHGQILRVTMRKHAVIHDVTSPGAAHTPTPIAGPMALLQKAVNGTLANANTLYTDQLLAAQHMLKVQQHRMAQLQAEEQRIAQLRLQAGQNTSRF